MILGRCHRDADPLTLERNRDSSPREVADAIVGGDRDLVRMSVVGRTGMPGMVSLFRWPWIEGSVVIFYPFLLSGMHDAKDRPSDCDRKSSNFFDAVWRIPRGIRPKTCLVRGGQVSLRLSP